MTYTFDEYQEDVKSKMATAPSPAVALTILGLGIAGESGEVADYIKKVVGHGHSLDADHLEEELGDVLWYITALASVLGKRLEDIAAKNTVKLHKRYPNGFSTERSINREGSK